MPTVAHDGFDSPPSFARRCLGIWRFAALLGGASLEGAALFWDLEPPSADSLAALSEAVERYMRLPAFLNIMKYSLKVMSRPIGFGNSHLRRRAHP